MTNTLYIKDTLIRHHPSSQGWASSVLQLLFYYYTTLCGLSQIVIDFLRQPFFLSRIMSMLINDNKDSQIKIVRLLYHR